MLLGDTGNQVISQSERERLAVCVIRLTEIQKNVDDRCERNNS